MIRNANSGAAGKPLTAVLGDLTASGAGPSAIRAALQFPDRPKTAAFGRKAVVQLVTVSLMAPAHC